MFNECLFILHSMLVVMLIWFAHQHSQSALMSLLCLFPILANLLLAKQIHLFALDVTTVEAYTIGTMLGINLIQDHYGAQEAKKLIHLATYGVMISGLLLQCHLAYTPSQYDHIQDSYALTFSPSFRFFMASVISFYTAQRLERWCFAQLKPTQFSFPIRCTLAGTIGQTFDTICFTLLALTGMAQHLGHVIMFSLILKTATTMLMSSFYQGLKTYFTPKDHHAQQDTALSL